MVGTADILLVIATQNIVVEQRYLQIHLPIITHHLYWKLSNLPIPAVTEVWATIDRVIGDMNDIDSLARIGVVPGSQYLAGIRIQIEHDFTRD